MRLGRRVEHRSPAEGGGGQGGRDLAGELLEAVEQPERLLLQAVPQVQPQQRRELLELLVGHLRLGLGA